MSAGASSGPPPGQAQAILTIDLAALVANWRRLRDLSRPAECAAVVKADAYGLGAEPVVRALADAGCRTFFVAHASEGVRVRHALGADPAFTIYALNGALPEPGFYPALHAHGVRPVLGSMEQVLEWLARGDASQEQPSIAIQFNTGMNRLGIDLSDAQEVHDLLAGAGVASKLSLVMSHFVSSEALHDPMNQEQVAAFAHLCGIFSGFRCSMANSSGIFLPQKPHAALVRPGYALYGGNPTPGEANPMRPVVRLEAPIIQLRDVIAGASVGYNAQWVARRDSRLATIGVGYADGVPRSAMDRPDKPGMQVVAGGRYCPVVGRISMDLIVIDVTDVNRGDINRGSMVEILGDDITIDDLAARSGTIGYEILTSLGPRYHRIYIGGR